MKLEVGKKYILENGETIEVKSNRPEIGKDWNGLVGAFETSKGTYTEDGKWLYSSTGDKMNVAREILTLQEGKYYEDANGEVQGPVRKYAHDRESFELSSATSHFWRDDGTAYEHHGCVDLLFEVPAPTSETTNELESIKLTVEPPAGFTVLTVMHTPADIKRARKHLKELARLLPPQP